MPRTLGESFIHVSQIDLAVEVDAPVHEVPRPVIGDVERRIGAYIADLVVDGATLQLGIGAIPAATASFLDGKKDLGIHTEMFTDAVVDLVEAGVVTGAAKARNRGKIVTAFLTGTRRLYDFVDDNPMAPPSPDAVVGRLATSALAVLTVEPRKWTGSAEPPPRAAGADAA